MALYNWEDFIKVTHKSPPPSLVVADSLTYGWILREAKVSCVAVLLSACSCALYVPGESLCEVRGNIT